MINHQDKSSFDDNRLYQEMKQTAQFFNPQMNSLGQTIKIQQKQLQKGLIKSPKEQALKLNFESKKNVLSRQTNEKRIAQTSKQQAIAKSAYQFVQNQYITPVMQKYGSPPKLNKVPQVKPFSPTQPQSSGEQAVFSKNNSVAPNIQKNGKVRFFQTPKTTGNEFNINMADFQSTNKQEQVKKEYPSYQKSLLDSRQSNYEYMQKSNSTAFLPKIKPQVQKVNNDQFLGYGSTGQQSQQETALRTNSSKQTITPFNEFININLNEDDISRQSKTAQQLRDSLEEQNLLQSGYKIYSVKQNEYYYQLPSISSPQQITRQQFTQQSTGGSGKPIKFLQSTPQKKIISRLFSSKSDNNQVI